MYRSGIFQYVFLILILSSCERNASITGTVRDVMDGSPAQGIEMRITSPNNAGAIFTSDQEGIFFTEFRHKTNQDSRLEIIPATIDTSAEVFVHFLSGNTYSRQDVSNAWQPLSRAATQTMDLKLMPAARLKINFPQDLPDETGAMTVSGDDTHYRFQIGILTRSGVSGGSHYVAVPALENFPVKVRFFGDILREYNDTIRIVKFRKHTYTPAIAF